MSENDCCLIGDCQNPAKTRGLCSTCYSAALLRVNSKLTTWGELEKLGLALPAAKVGRAVESKFGKAFDAAKDASILPELDAQNEANVEADLAKSMSGNAAAMHGAPPADPVVEKARQMTDPIGAAINLGELPPVEPAPAEFADCAPVVPGDTGLPEKPLDEADLPWNQGESA